jgi:hypothetical protein
VSWPMIASVLVLSIGEPTLEAKEGDVGEHMSGIAGLPA